MASRSGHSGARAVLTSLILLEIILSITNRQELVLAAAPSGSSDVGKALVENSSILSSRSSSSSSDGSHFNVGLFVPIIGTAVLLLLGGTCCLCMHRQWKQVERKGGDSDDESGNNHTVMISFSSQRGTTGDYSRGETARTSQVAGLTNTGESRRTQPLPPRESYELGTDSGPGYVWKLLLEDPNLATKRLWYTDIKLRPRLARSQSREIRLGEFRGKKVIIKRLLRTKRSQSFYVQEFVYQIQLRAAITHPHIVAFIGVAWNNLTDLMMVLEFLPLGDLATYLQRFGNELSWENSKYRIAVGIARALVYLHNYATPVVHRDLRASNVLLTREMEAKVTGFDSSCASEDSHRSHLVGGSFWSAPEVLRGKEYTDKSDIYAFGVLLTELDMTKPPYHDAFSSIGARLKPDQILNEVVQGTMRPSFSQECPRRIRVIGVGCYQHDPQRRPTAKQLLRLLEA